MRKATLTPERMAIREKQESKWFDGDRGYAISWPYRVKRYLSKELSDKICAEVQAKANEWIEKFNSIKPSKRYTKSVFSCNWCKELEPQKYYNSDDKNAIPTEVLGHKIYVQILDSYRKGNGQYGIKVMDKPAISFSSYVNKRSIGDSWHCQDEARLNIGFDEEKQQYFICQYYRAENTPIERITRKNWGRTTKRREFMNEVKKLEDSLTNSGVNIIKFESTKLFFNGGWLHGLEDYFIRCEGPDVA